AAAGVLGVFALPQGLPPTPSVLPNPSHPAGVPAPQAEQPAGARAKRSDQPPAPPPPSAGPTHDALDDAVASTGAPDEQLDIAAELDQGHHLFLLRGRYQDDNYYVARPQGISHQPLSDLF